MPGLKEAGIGQKSQYYQIVIDPNGSVWDAFKGDTGVNIDMKYKVINLKNRMYFEIAVPFKELKCISPQNNSQWFVNFYWNRHVTGKNQSYAWAGTGSYHDSSRFGTLEFKENKPAKRKKK